MDSNSRSRLRIPPGNETGFTIVETTISIAIFSFLIIFCLGMFIFVGRIYYRGLYEGQTQSAARSIVDNIAEDLRTSGKALIEIPLGSEGWQAYCIGGRKYSFRKNVQLVSVSSGKREADQVFIISGDCNDVNKPQPPATGGTELLQERMRLLEFKVERLRDSELYQIDIKVALGGDASDLEYDGQVFKYVNSKAVPPAEVDLLDPNFHLNFGNQVDWEDMPVAPRKPHPTYPKDYYSHHDDTGTETVNLEITQCQPSESFCAVIEFSTKAFRKVF